MTNEVENLILSNVKKEKITYEQNIAYLFYKEVWGFIMAINKYDYQNAEVVFKVKKNGNSYYISGTDGIKFEIINNDFKSGWNNYYEGCEEYYIKNVLNTNIDFRLLIKLLYADGFHCDYYDEDDNFFVYVDIDKHTVNKNIDNVLLKNRVLKKEM